MNRPVISQNEAYRLKRRVVSLEAILTGQKKYWATDWPSSTVLGRFEVNVELQAIVRTARLLEHAVVCTIEGAQLKLFGLRLPK